MAISDITRKDTESTPAAILNVLAFFLYAGCTCQNTSPAS